MWSWWTLCWGTWPPTRTVWLQSSCMDTSPGMTWTVRILSVSIVDCVLHWWNTIPSILVCSNIECVDFNNHETRSTTPCYHFNIRADVSDETGTLTSVKMSPVMLEKLLGPLSDFIWLTDETKTLYKWKIMFKPQKLTLALLLPTPESMSSHSMVVDMTPATYEEMSIKMPSPTGLD